MRKWDDFDMKAPCDEGNPGGFALFIMALIVLSILAAITGCVDAPMAPSGGEYSNACYTRMVIRQDTIIITNAQGDSVGVAYVTMQMCPVTESVR